MSSALPSFLPARSIILSLFSSRSLPVCLCHGTHVWTCGKMLCQQVGRGTTDAGWSPKELASSAFPNTIFKCQSCIKAYPAVESQWHGSDEQGIVHLAIPFTALLDLCVRSPLPSLHVAELGVNHGAIVGFWEAFGITSCWYLTAIFSVWLQQLCLSFPLLISAYAPFCCSLCYTKW